MQSWYTVIDEESTIVEVEACKDAHFLLSTGLSSWDKGYEVALGTHMNNYSVIREDIYGTNKVTAETPGILSCDEYR